MIASSALASWQEIQREASELIAAAGDRDLCVRIVGSAGIRMHCKDASATMDALGRPAKDLDLVVRSSDRGKLRALIEERGYEIDRDLLVAMEGHRFAFRHPGTGIDLDVFVGKLEFCHTIELGDRWQHHAVTLPIEDLLLQKLQVHEVTQSDLIDTAVLLATHGVDRGGDEETIDCTYISGLLARDWGFHRDATANLARVREAAGREVPLPGDGARRVGEATALLSESIDGAKKSMGWKMRARVGERTQWWEDVDEREETY
ncbi:MAG TPA: hypothetical protein VGI87_14030 [Solirubrobacteraceae bacterium]